MMWQEVFLGGVGGSKSPMNEFWQLRSPSEKNTNK